LKMKPEEAVQELGAKNSEFRKKMEELKETVEMLAKPDGSKDNPARTCRDIKSYYPNSPSGMYWLDPNRGCTSDAIQVHCNFTIDEIITCVRPKDKESIPKDVWSSKLTHARKWMVEDHNLANIEYEADMSQLTYLSYLSREAFQTVTVHCKNHIVWYDSAAGNHKSAMHFMGTKHTQFTPISKKRVMYETISDGCQHNRNNWDSTVLKFRTSKFVRLPIVDVAPVKQGKTSEFGLEMGSVCFV